MHFFNFHSFSFLYFFFFFFNDTATTEIYTVMNTLSLHDALPICNTLRFLLANISDFDPKRNAMPVADWVEIDRYAVALTHELQKSVLEDFDGYEFHPAAAKLQNFCSEELSAFYLDVLKDRLYTCGKDSPARRSSQNALYHVTQSLLRLIAPVLSFTAEEAWGLFQPGDDSVFAHTYYRLPEVPGAEALLAK